MMAHSQMWAARNSFKEFTKWNPQRCFKSITVSDPKWDGGEQVQIQGEFLPNCGSSVGKSIVIGSQGLSIKTVNMGKTVCMEYFPNISDLQEDAKKLALTNHVREQ